MADRRHGGAALQNVPLTTPGFLGLNTERSTSLLGPEWATTLENAVIDDAGRLAARNGWSDSTTTPAAAQLVAGEEFVQHDESVELIFSTATTFLRSTDGGGTFSDITGTATAFTDGYWQFINFNDKMIGVKYNATPVVYGGSSFSDIADVNVPTGRCGASFAGRLWIADNDGHTIKYSALLDETDWTSSDSGSFNLMNVWQGTDTVTGMIAHNGALVVFGKKNTVFLVDGQGSTLGIDPAQAYVADIIKGVGCIAQESIQVVDGDLWFLSESGLQSLGRLINERSNPMNNLSNNVHTELMSAVNEVNFDITRLRSVYSPKDRFYLLSLPRESGVGTGIEQGELWIFDTRLPMQDRSARCLGKWTGIVPTLLIYRRNRDLLCAAIAHQGEVFKYSGRTDNGNTFDFEYLSGWSDLGAPNVTKILKRFSGIFLSDITSTVQFKWAFDFSSDMATRTKTFTSGVDRVEWGAGTWGVSEWSSGGLGLREGNTIPSGTGQFIKWGIKTMIDGQSFSIQQLDLYAKIGRLA